MVKYVIVLDEKDKLENYCIKSINAISKECKTNSNDTVKWIVVDYLKQIGKTIVEEKKKN